MLCWVFFSKGFFCSPVDHSLCILLKLFFFCFHKVQLANSSSAIYPKVSKIYFELLFLCCFVLFYTLGIRNKNLVRDLSMNPVCLLLFLLTLTCAKFPGYIFFLVIIGGRSGYRLSFFFLKKRSELFSFFDFLSSSFPTSRKNQLGFFFFVGEL